VAHPALGAKSKIYLSPLHIKIGLTKISVKAMDKEREGFGYLRQKFPTTSEAKMKKEFLLVHTLHNHSKTKTPVQD
jgi:hypothetical protein